MSSGVYPGTNGLASIKAATFSLKNLKKVGGGTSIQAVEKLLASTAIDARDVDSNQTLLEYACRSAEASLAKYCYRKGAVLTELTRSGESLVNIATLSKNYDLMEFFLTYGVPVNFADAKGRTPIHTAASNKDVDAICRLIELGADVNARDLEGKTALHLATAKGHATTVELLLELGARLNEADNKGFTAVAHAEVNDHFKLMDRLLSLGGQGYRVGKEIKEQPKKYGVDEASVKTLHGAKLGQLPAFPLSSTIPGFLHRIGKYTPKAPRQPIG